MQRLTDRQTGAFKFRLGFLKSARPLTPPAFRKAGRKLTYLVGAAVGGSAAVWVYYGAGDRVST